MRTTNAISALNLTDLSKLAPFGKDVAYSEDDIVRESYLLNFTNKEIDYNLDLHYFGARYYTADFPRFISPDPVSGKLETPITWNRYLYCRNDPINYIDPDGRDAFTTANWELFNKVFRLSGWGNRHYPEAIMAVYQCTTTGVIDYDIARGSRNRASLPARRYWPGRGALVAIIHSHHDGQKPTPSTENLKGDESDEYGARYWQVPFYNTANKGNEEEIEGYEDGSRQTGVYKIDPVGVITPEESIIWLRTGTDPAKQAEGTSNEEENK